MSASGWVCAHVNTHDMSGYVCMCEHMCEHTFVHTRVCTQTCRRQPCPRAVAHFKSWEESFVMCSKQMCWSGMLYWSSSPFRGKSCSNRWKHNEHSLCSQAWHILCLLHCTLVILLLRIQDRHLGWLRWASAIAHAPRQDACAYSPSRIVEIYNTIAWNLFLFYVELYVKRRSLALNDEVWRCSCIVYSSIARCGGIFEIFEVELFLTSSKPLLSTIDVACLNRCSSEQTNPSYRLLWRNVSARMATSGIMGLVTTSIERTVSAITKLRWVSLCLTKV